eukprot:TRINITY_DN4180_c0_g1_i1.p1 TRINITY_DN4180_c0_g1~~TRINITY_DN4180_c0_g1_i1.p1  ORF type:complete len:434 (+),score=173.97 TRINITY_DN4180_c0_g1_i1:44-1303(+)
MKDYVYLAAATAAALSALVVFLTVMLIALVASIPVLTFGLWVTVPLTLMYCIFFLSHESRFSFAKRVWNTLQNAKFAFGHAVVQTLHSTLTYVLHTLHGDEAHEISPDLRALEIIVRMTRDPRPLTVERFRTVCDGYHFLFWYNKAVHRDTKHLPAEEPKREVTCHFMRTAIEPDARPSIMLYLHGGGFIAGTAGAYRGMISPVAKRINCNVFAVEYRKMPEHPLPAAVDDALVAYRYLIQEKKFDPSSIILAGDSAGGSLCLLLLLRLKEVNLPQPSGAMLMSPYVDLTVSSASWVRNRGRDFILNEQVIDAAREMFTMQKNFTIDDARRFSPATYPHTSFEGLPPMFLSYSTAEPLIDEILVFISKAKQAGVNLTTIQRDGCPHVYQMFYAYCPEAKAAMDAGVKFMQTCLDGRMAR